VIGAPADDRRPTTSRTERGSAAFTFAPTALWARWQSRCATARRRGRGHRCGDDAHTVCAVAHGAMATGTARTRSRRSAGAVRASAGNATNVRRRPTKRTAEPPMPQQLPTTGRAASPPCRTHRRHGPHPIGNFPSADRRKQGSPRHQRLPIHAACKLGNFRRPPPTP
jgi:hypothetical protein